MSTYSKVWPPADYIIRPEKKERKKNLIDRVIWEVMGCVERFRHARIGNLKYIVSEVDRHYALLRKKSDGDLRIKASHFRRRLRVEGFAEDLIAEVFALVREAAVRTVGMCHFDCQLVGGYAILKGLAAEMETGEGKTLVATLPAAAAAMAGIPVHVITVNDYLTARDAAWMGELYRFLGLSADFVIHEKTHAERRTAYASDITYCTNKELVFDYLRDRIVLGDYADQLRLHGEGLYETHGRSGRLLLRGLHYAIVDEADSVLVDEARTPLIISKTEDSDEEKKTVKEVLSFAESLKEKVDYRIEYELDEGLKRVVLTDSCRTKAERVLGELGRRWRSSVRREELTRKALTALHLFHRDEQYLVRDGKIQIIDEFTGRVMPDRSWEGGLHQLIEVKEKCEITGQRDTVARISYQRFFRRYMRLSGMTGTAREVRRELWSVYGLPVVRIPTNRPVRRHLCPDRIAASSYDKWLSVLQRIRQLHEEDRPVLVGTRTVADSEYLSSILAKENILHRVLNAKQDAEEAEVIADAGKPGRVTIATNMAGRGTDIKLAPGVADKGGLSVIMTERHEAGRIDRQLAGRCGRQGDPGSFEAFLSLDDLLLEGGAGGFVGTMSLWMKKMGWNMWKRAGKYAIRRAQKRLERVHAGMRKRLLKYDEERGDTLSFSGKRE